MRAVCDLEKILRIHLAEKGGKKGRSGRMSRTRCDEMPREKNNGRMCSMYMVHGG